MCRYNSGVSVNVTLMPQFDLVAQFFWRHELLQDYDYYWRIELAYFPGRAVWHHSYVLVDPTSGSTATLTTTHSCSCKIRTKFTVFLSQLDPLNSIITSLAFHLNRFHRVFIRVWGNHPNIVGDYQRCVQSRFIFSTNMVTRNIAFIKEHPEYLPKDNAMAFLSADGGETYNRCHCMLSFLNAFPCLRLAV